MNRYMTESDESEWTDDERLFLSVQQFAPRKWRWQSVVVVGFTFVFGLAAGLCVIIGIGATNVHN